MSETSWVPTETRIKSILSRQMRLYSLTLRPESASLCYNHVQNYFSQLWDQGKIGPENVMKHVDDVINSIVDTSLQVTKDQKNITIIEPTLMTQILNILLSYEESRQKQQQHQQQLNGNDNNNDNNNDNKAIIGSIDVDKAIKYATLQQTQPVFILDPFNMPKFLFSEHQNQYIPAVLSQFQNPGSTQQRPLTRLGNNNQLHSDPLSQTKMFTDKYFSIFQRCQRQERYAQHQRQIQGKNQHQRSDSSSILHQTDNTRIYEVDSLRGNVGELTVFGYISDIIGDLYLESPNSRICLDLSNCTLLDSDAIPVRSQGDGNDNNNQQQQQQQMTTYTTYTTNTQLSQAVHNYIDSTQQQQQHRTPNSKSQTPLRARQTLTPSSKFNNKPNGIDPTDNTSIIDHSSLFAKLFTIGSFVLITGQTVGNIFVAKRCQLPKHEPRKATLELYPALQIINPYTDYISNPIQHYTYHNGKILKEQMSILSNNQPGMIQIAKSGTIPDVNSQIKNQKLLLEALEEVDQGGIASIPGGGGGGSGSSGSTAVQTTTTTTTSGINTNHSMDRIIILGETYLHDQATINKIHQMLNDLENYPPQYIIFTGNYISPQFYIQNRFNPYAFKILFDRLGSIFFGYKNLRLNTHFIFAAGTFDYMYGNTTPIPPLQPSMVNGLTKILNNVTFTSNLVNIRYFGRDLKIIRSDFYQSIINRDTSHFINSKIVDDISLPDDIRIEKQKREYRKQRRLFQQHQQQQEEEKQQKHQYQQQLKTPSKKSSNFGMGDDDTTNDQTTSIVFNLDDELEQLNQLSSINNLDNNNGQNGGSNLNQDYNGDDNNDDDDDDDDDDYTRFIGDMVVKYITSQDTLLVDHPSVKPTLWDYSHAFSLVTLPDAVIMVDTERPYNINKYGTVFYNTGPFTGKWSYVQYFPQSNTVFPVILQSDENVQ